jgi:hypothetical protein
MSKQLKNATIQNTIPLEKTCPTSTFPTMAKTAVNRITNPVKAKKPPKAIFKRWAVENVGMFASD